jgi:Bacterial regulatory helix-turn-helix protein, lysR family
MNVELRHLRYFVAVAEEASFTAAARRVHVAQQAPWSAPLVGAAGRRRLRLNCPAAPSRANTE